MLPPALPLVSMLNRTQGSIKHPAEGQDGRRSRVTLTTPVLAFTPFSRLKSHR